MFCPFCSEWVKIKISTLTEGECTCVGHFEAPGHMHDPNKYCFGVECLNGHKMKVFMQKACPMKNCKSHYTVAKLEVEIIHDE